VSKAYVTMIATACLLAVWTPSQAAESWPQWRGPTRDGVAAKGPALLASWPANGPLKVWESEPIPTGKEGGFGSVTVAGGKAYLFVGLKEPLVTRRIGGGDRWAIDLGLVPDGPDKLPEALAKASEDARLSPERVNLKNEEILAWADNWIAKNLKDEEKTKFGPFLKKRLAAGNRAIPLASFAKLEEARKKEFANQAELDKWFQDQGIQGPQRESVMRLVPTVRDATEDAVFCLDAETGKTLWKKKYPNAPMPDPESAGSSTPAVFDGRVYASGCLALYCLNAADGAEIWKSAPPEYGPNCSSPLLVDGLIVVRSGRKLGLAGYDAKDGKLLWNEKQIASGRGWSSSAAAWVKDGKSYVLCNDDKLTFCLEAKTGKLLWSVPGGGCGTPIISGDILVTAGGLAAYRLAPDKGELLWSRGGTLAGTSAVVYDGCVYGWHAMKLACVKLADGTVLWEQKGPFCGGGYVGYSSPSLADGKLYMVGESGLLTMVRVSPEKFELLGEVKDTKALGCTVPAIVNGRMFLRMKTNVACFDLTAGVQ
jgi:outer membrane protein assembly factor BamB